MAYEFYEQWAKMGKGFNLPINDLGKAAGEVYRHTAEKNIELFSQNLELVSDQLKRLSHVHKPDEFISLQKECLHEDISATVVNVQKIMHLAIANMEELSRIYSTTATKVTEKAVEKAQRFTEKAEK